MTAGCWASLFPFALWAAASSFNDGNLYSNRTYASTSDPNAHRKAAGRESRLCFMGHVLMKNRNGWPSRGRSAGRAARPSARWRGHVRPAQPAVALGHARCRQGLRRRKFRRVLRQRRVMPTSPSTAASARPASAQTALMAASPTTQLWH